MIAFSGAFNILKSLTCPLNCRFHSNKVSFNLKRKTIFHFPSQIKTDFLSFICCCCFCAE